MEEAIMGTKLGTGTQAKSTSLNVINAIDVYSVVERLLTVRQSEVTPRACYSAINSFCAKVRSDHGMQPAAATLALLAVDPVSDKQQRFIDVLRKAQIAPEAIDFRWTYAGMAESRGDREEKSVSTLAPNVCYALGLLAGRAEAQGGKAEVVVVGGAFGIAHSLLDFCQNRHGRAVVVFPRSMLDHRWSWIGLGTSDCPIEYVDLEPESAAVFGAPFPSTWRKEGVTGLAGI
jgi:hypothetical protein